MSIWLAVVLGLIYGSLTFVLGAWWKAIHVENFRRTGTLYVLPMYLSGDGQIRTLEMLRLNNVDPDSPIVQASVEVTDEGTGNLTLTVGR